MRVATSLVAAALLVSTTGCSDLEGTGDKGFITAEGTIRHVASDEREDPISYEGEDLDGRALAVEDLRGKPVVISVWGSWCSPCRKEAPWVAGASEELGDDVEFLGINLRDAGTAQAQAFERSFGFEFPSLYEPDGEAMLAFPGVLGVRSIPSFVVLDAQGRVAASIIGQLPSQQTLVDLVEDVVGAPAGGADGGAGDG